MSPHAASSPDLAAPNTSTGTGPPSPVLSGPVSPRLRSAADVTLNSTSTSGLPPIRVTKSVSSSALAAAAAGGSASYTNTVHPTPWIARVALHGMVRSPSGDPTSPTQISPIEYIELVGHDAEDAGTSGTSDSEATARAASSPRIAGLNVKIDAGYQDDDDDDIVVYAGGDEEQLLDKGRGRRASSGLSSPVVALQVDADGVITSAGPPPPRRPWTWKTFWRDAKDYAVDSVKSTYVTMTTVDWSLISQATPSLMLATAGLIFAGWLLDIVQHWPVFARVSELFILVPIILNLKGNLEMNLASRLATAANAGLLSNGQDAKSVISGNLLLLQVQAIVVGTLAGFTALMLGSIFHPEFNTWSEDFLLINTSVLTATVTSLLLGTLMCGLVVACKYFHLDPDNIATPIAATLGDLVTLWILAGISHLSLLTIDTPATPIVLFGVLLSLPIWAVLAFRNNHVNGVLRRGWTPIVISMCISSMAGLVMERYIQRFQGLAILIPVLNGVVGNLGTIYCARYSSKLHLGENEDHARTQVSLFWINLPLQSIFLVAVHFVGLGHTSVTPMFTVAYLSVSILLLIIILKMGRAMCSWLWAHGMDPDDHALPYLTSICDVLGTIMIVMTFFILFYLGDRDQDVGE